MRRSPLYALLCFQLAFAPAALAAQPTWEAKRANMAKELKEALKSLDELDRSGPLCSDNYSTSQCPSIMPPPKQTFVETAKKNLKALAKDVDGIAPDAKIADQPFDPKKLQGVDGCAGAGTAAATDAAKRKAAVDKMNAVFAKVNSTLSGDLGKLFEGGAGFKAKAKACVNASNLSFVKKMAVSAMLPEYPHGALEYMWTPDNAHKSCPRSGVDTFRKLTGAKKGDGKAQLARIAGTGQEYAANLTKNSAELTKYTQVAGKVDCKSADQTKVAGKKDDPAPSAISGDKEEKTGTLAAAEAEPKPVPGDGGKNPDTEQPAADIASAETPPADTTQTPPADSTPVADQSPPTDTLGGAEQTAEAPKAGLSKGHVVAGLAVLGVGAGAAYLIFSKKNKDSDKDTGDRTPSSTNTQSTTATSTATKTGTNTNSNTSTKTATSTNTGPNSSVPYTGTLTATTFNTQTATSTSTATATETQSGTATATSTATSTNTGTSTATRQ